MGERSDSRVSAPGRDSGAPGTAAPRRDRPARDCALLFQVVRRKWPLASLSWKARARAHARDCAHA